MSDEKTFDSDSKLKKVRKRIIIDNGPKESKITTPTSVIPAVDILVNDAKAIICSELARYRTKSERGVTLDLKEARVIQGYLETLIKLQREEREQARSDDLSNLTNEELLELASKVLGNTQPRLTRDSKDHEE
jgi:hypothetical protein